MKRRSLLAQGQMRAGRAPVVFIEGVVDEVGGECDEVREERAGGEDAADSPALERRTLPPHGAIFVLDPEWEPAD